MDKSKKLMSSFPTLVDRKENIDLNKTWAIVADTKLAYMYDFITYSFLGVKELQPSPLEPGVFLKPENVTDLNPVEVCGELGDKEEYYFNTDTKTWSKRKDIFLFPLYSKDNGELVKNPIREYYHTYTPIVPLSTFIKWSNEDNNWIIDLELAKSVLVNKLRLYEIEITNQDITIDNVEYHGINNLSSYVDALNTLTNDTETTFILKDTELLEVNKPTLKKLIEACKNIRVDSLKSLAYFKPSILSSNTIEELYDVLELKPIKNKTFKTDLDINNTVLLQYVNKLLTELNTKREVDEDHELPDTNPSIELMNSYSTNEES